MLIEKLRRVNNIMSTDKHRDRRNDRRIDSRPTNGQRDSNIPPKLRFRGINIQLHPTFYQTNNIKLYVSIFIVSNKNHIKCSIYLVSYVY